MLWDFHQTDLRNKTPCPQSNAPLTGSVSEVETQASSDIDELALIAFVSSSFLFSSSMGVESLKKRCFDCGI